MVIALIIFLAAKFLPPWMRYEQFHDQMRTEAQFGTTLADSVIQARLIASADTLGLPSDAKHITITRGGDPPRIRISCAYSEHVALPILGVEVLHFHPSAEEAL